MREGRRWKEEEREKRGRLGKKREEGVSERNRGGSEMEGGRESEERETERGREACIANHIYLRIHYREEMSRE